MEKFRFSACGLGLLALFLITLLAGPPAEAFLKFGKDKAEPRVVLVLVDMSGSTNQARRTVYREAFGKVYENIQPGDRLVVGTITSHSFIEFKPAVDVEIPKQSIWDNRIRYEQNIAKTKKNIEDEIERLLSQKKGTPYTEILNSLNIADNIFHSEKRRKVLVILSDMIQDSKSLKFERIKLTRQYTENLISQRRRQNLLPDLSGVRIYVAGASATDSEKFRSIQNFWTQYFVATGADFDPHRYGHSLIEFEKHLTAR